MEHRITWVEIPVSDIERAGTFYGKLFDQSLPRVEMDGTVGYNLPDGFGAIRKSDGFNPASDGPTIYIHMDDINGALERVKQAGGAVVTEKTSLGGESGFYAEFTDSEGNKIGLHSMR
jgi:hypothetical protein